MWENVQYSKFCDAFCIKGAVKIYSGMHIWKTIKTGEGDMNYLWAFMILTGIIYRAFHGNPAADYDGGARFGKKGGLRFCITMMG